MGRLIIGLGLLAAIMVAAGSANAQATRTWVSGVGDDANPCSRTAPCKTFAGAISKTAAGGEINALDPGGFGAVTITKSISIISQVEAGVLVSGTNGIIVNAASTDKVLLEGLEIEGLRTGLSGIRIIGGGQVAVRKCAIRNFTQYGVDLEGAESARVFIEDSFITGNTLGGLLIQGAASAVNHGIMDRTIVDNNGATSVKVAGPSTLYISGSMLDGAAAAIDASGGASVISYGNNVIRGAGSPTATLPRS